MRNNYIKRTLSNGVRVYLYLDQNMKKAFVSYGIFYGSNGKWSKFYLDDQLHEVKPGCAHFLEHMLGEHSKYGNFYTYLANQKYRVNASTAFNTTQFYFQGVENILDSIEKLITIVDCPVFTENDVEETKRAIAEETKRVLNDKVRVAMALNLRNLFKGVNLFDKSLATIGNEKTTYELDYQTLKDCYDAFYYDENKVLVIAGNFEEEKLIDFLEGVYKKIPKHPKRLKEYTYKDFDKCRKREETFNLPTNDSYCFIGFRQKNTNFTPKEISTFMSIFSEIKYSDETDFIKNLKDKNILSTTHITDFDIINETYYQIAFSAIVKDTKAFKEALIKEFKKDDFKEQDFELIKRDMIAHNIFKTDNKYSEFLRFIPNLEFTENFDDADFLDKLTFKRFKEFYNSLNFDDNVMTIIKDKNETN